MNKKRNVGIGLLFIGAGILFFLSAAGFLQAGIGMYIVCFALLVLAINWLFSRNFFGSMYALVFMIRFFPGNLPFGLEKVGTGRLFLIATLFALGLSYIFRGSSFHFPKGSAAQEQLTGPHIKCSSTFNDNSKYIYGNELQTGELSTNFGSLSVYFNEVELQNNVNLNVDVSFGTIELYFPRDWKVRENVNVVFGDVKSMVRFDNSEYTIYISGNVSFGNLKINYF